MLIGARLINGCKSLKVIIANFPSVMVPLLICLKIKRKCKTEWFRTTFQKVQLSRCHPKTSEMVQSFLSYPFHMSQHTNRQCHASQNEAQITSTCQWKIHQRNIHQVVGTREQLYIHRRISPPGILTDNGIKPNILVHDTEVLLSDEGNEFNFWKGKDTYTWFTVRIT